MPIIYDSAINKGVDTLRTGHECYPKATYTSEQSTKKIIFKVNKHGKGLSSLLESGMTNMAKRRMNPRFKAAANLVVNEKNQATGVAVEHMEEVLKKHLQGKTCYALPVDKNNKISGDITKARASLVDETSPPKAYFLDQFQEDYFSQLKKLQQKGKIGIDEASLANCLAAAHFLEEDDLHKGNIGFYIGQKEGKPEVVFFKIDDDLMFMDQIMSRYNPRLFHGAFAKSAFRITVDALEKLPIAKAGQDARYWPTSKAVIYKPNDRRVYSHPDERVAFKSLCKSEAFKNEKWRTYLKQILIPNELDWMDLQSDMVDSNDPQSRAHAAMLNNAMAERTAELRAVLFTSAEFRRFLETFENGDELADEILYDNPESKEMYKEKILERLTQYKAFATNSYEQGDTPLHVAIKLGDYRYQESWRLFGRYCNQKNVNGKTPCDLGKESLMSRDLQMRSGKLTPDFQSIIKRLGEKYIKGFEDAASHKELLNLFQALGEDTDLGLKTKKQIALAGLKAFVENSPATDKSDILETMHKNFANTPQLQFIRQLRSEWYVIRMIRGLWGRTSTQDEMLAVIGAELADKPAVGNRV